MRTLLVATTAVCWVGFAQASSLRGGSLPPTPASIGAVPLNGSNSMTGPLTTVNLGKTIIFPWASGGQSFAFDANPDELNLTANASGDNVMAITQLNANGFAAQTYRGVDQYYSGVFEHMAKGWGPGLVFRSEAGYDFDEISRYVTANGSASQITTLPPSRHVFQQTGAVFQSNPGYPVNITFTAGSTTATAASAIPAAYAGFMLYSVDYEGYIPPNETIAAGTGSTSFTLSSPALVSGTIPVFIGATFYCQASLEEHSSMGPINWYTWFQGCGGNLTASPIPAMTFDRWNGRLGLGTKDPITAADVVGKAWFGADTSSSRSANGFGYTDGAINLDPTDGHYEKWLIPGVDTASIDYNTTSKSFDYIDKNNNLTMLKVYMDGSGAIAAPQGVYLDASKAMWVKEVSGKVYVGTGTTNLFSIDSSGNVIAKGTITGSQTP